MASSFSAATIPPLLHADEVLAGWLELAGVCGGCGVVEKVSENFMEGQIEP